MTIKSSGSSLAFSEIETEFGAQSPRSLGSYRHSQTVNGLTFNGIDSGIPTSGTIKFSDFYGKSLNIVVDCYSGGDEFRISAKNNKWNNNQIVIINPSTVSKKEEGTKITIRVNKKFGSDKSSVNNCALKTGTWSNPASVIVDLGSSAKILGAGGNGGRGADGITNPGVDGGDGSSGLVLSIKERLLIIDLVQLFVLVSLVAVAVEEVKRLLKTIEELAVEAVAVVLVSRLELVDKVVFRKQVQDKQMRI